MSRVRLLLFVWASVCLVVAGAFLVLLLLYVLGDPNLESLLVLGQCVGVVLALVSCLACLDRARWALAITITAIAVVYAVGAISLATGSWAWLAVANAGSAVPGLMFGSHVIASGDLPPIRIDPVTWLVELTILTAATAYSVRAIIAYLRRGDNLGIDERQAH